MPWGDLDTLYHSLWDLNKPILLETSPPEKDHADALFSQFAPHGQVNFVLLVRRPCSVKTSMPKMSWLVKAKGIVERSVHDCD